MIFPKCLLVLLPVYAALSYVNCAKVSSKITEAAANESLQITGSEIRLPNGTVRQYLGIRFAEPPINEKRFRKTVPLETPLGNFSAVEEPPACSQYYPVPYDVMDNMKNKSEDCLFLNIWVPGDASPAKPKAVMIWLYGVGFATGSNRLKSYNASWLASLGGIIVVVPNYRVGIFGFLSTDSDEAPGNMGLYDVLEALKWVRSNIKLFGGDVNRITMAGNTAGSLISGLFTISPLTKGMFQRVIMETGADLTVRGDIKQYNLQIGQRVATLVGCASETRTLQRNTEEVLQCLRNKTADELVNATSMIMETNTVLFLPIYGDEFLPQTPSTAYGSGNAHNVSVMIGDVEDGGTFQLATVYANVFGSYGEKEPEINKTFATQLIDDGLRKDSINNSEALRDIPNFYLKNESDTNNYQIRNQTQKAFGDINNLCNGYYFAQNYSALTTVFFYYFVHRTPFTPFVNWTGVTIFSEVPYVFGIPIYNDSFTPEEAALSRKMVRYWSNFVKDGVPSPDWSKFVGSDDTPYVEILRVQDGEGDSIYQRFRNCEFLRQYILNYYGTG